VHFNKNIYLGLGTNVGNRKRNILNAVLLLKKQKDIFVLKVSRIYETKAWGYTKQKNFYNAVVEIKTDINPHKLLVVCKNIEKKMLRRKNFKWGPRKIDIDILLYKNRRLRNKNLTIPHKYIRQRVFVLQPLIDLNGSLCIDGANIKSIAEKLGSESELSLVG